MTLTRTICGLAVLAGSAASASAQLPVMPAPTGPNRLVFPAPPWITNAPRPGGVTGPAATGPVSRTPAVNEVRPNWERPGARASAVPAPVASLEPVQSQSVPPQGMVIPAIPPVPVAASPRPPAPGAIVVPPAPPVVTATYVPPPAPTAQPARPAARPTTPATAARPEVWTRGGSVAAPSTLPGTTVPAPRGR